MQTAILREATAYARSHARGLHCAPCENIAGDTHLASQNNYGKLRRTSLVYRVRRVPPERPPIFTLGWQERGGGGADKRL